LEEDFPPVTPELENTLNRAFNSAFGGDVSINIPRASLLDRRVMELDTNQNWWFVT